MDVISPDDVGATQENGTKRKRHDWYHLKGHGNKSTAHRVKWIHVGKFLDKVVKQGKTRRGEALPSNSLY